MRLGHGPLHLLPEGVGVPDEQLWEDTTNPLDFSSGA
jgi:hypothetical protein